MATLVEIYFVQGEKMRLNKKFLGVLLSVLLTAMLITIPVTPVSAAATVSVGRNTGIRTVRNDRVCYRRTLYCRSLFHSINGVE
jgi:magnesium-transporting ATPase (P-type)